MLPLRLAAAKELLLDGLGESADDLLLAVCRMERMPDGHQPLRRRAAEATGHLDQRDLRPGLGRLQRREDTGAAAAYDDNVKIAGRRQALTLLLRARRGGCQSAHAPRHSAQHKVSPVNQHII